MPAVRFARDKRGYEYVYLVHTPQRRGKPGRQRVLYWYRTPPGVAIGRKPFDPDVQRALERQYPGLTFDWDTIVSTPMPPPDMTEYWRERRRAERAAKQERKAAEAAELAATASANGSPEGEDDDGEAQGDTAVEVALADAPPFVEVSLTPVNVDVDPGPDVSTAAEAAPAAVDGAANGDPASGRRRRRRRGGRRRRTGPADAAEADSGSAGAGPENLDDAADETGEDDPSDSSSEEQ